MREYLFRGKRLDNGEWAYGNFVMDATEQVQRENNVEDPILADGFIRRYEPEQRKIVMHEVDRSTVGQWTGFFDKDGTRIFEGDILKKINPVPIETVDHYRVEWCDDCGLYELVNITIRGNARSFQTHYGFQFEVIGNIHDNPELLEDSEE